MFARLSIRPSAPHCWTAAIPSLDDTPDDPIATIRLRLRGAAAVTPARDIYPFGEDAQYTALFPALGDAFAAIMRHRSRLWERFDPTPFCAKQERAA